jgi:glycerate dehydrogenase
MQGKILKEGRMPMKIVVLDGYTENPGDLSWEGLARLGDLVVYDRTAPDQVIGRIGDAEAVFTNKTPLPRAIFDACPGIRFVGMLATGYNVVDTAAVREKRIVLSNVPSYGTNAVSQFVFALLLEICHNVAHHSAAVHQGRWTSCPDYCFWDFPLVELAGKTLGIVGFGRIGKATARIANAFGMRVLAVDANQTDEGRALATYVSLDELLAASDVISLHCPLLPSTSAMINRESIGCMKDGVILINTARGGLVNETDLKEALDSGKVGYAAVDVVSTEPVRADNPLLAARNCIITPHIAWAPKESRARLMQAAVENLEMFIKGTPINVVIDRV